ncbi:MAG: hypothetical protein GX542_02145 [Rhodococcus sp.]|nr:hypothetical protein [Rhodococcus sp. (in: high G+C Gram-positive bacteria)]
MAEPSSELIAPVANDPVPNLLENALDGSLTSPTYLVGEALVFCGMVGTNDPWAWVADQLAGDWQALQTAGKSLDGLAKFNTALSEELSAATSLAMQTWKGDAAASATQYFTELSETIGRQSGAIRRMAEQLDQTSLGMYEASEAVKDLISMLIDWLIAVTVNAVAGMVSGPTPAGAAFLAAALLMAKKAWDVVSKIHQVLGAAWAGAQSTVGLIAGHLATVRDVRLPQLPDAAYQPGGA